MEAPRRQSSPIILGKSYAMIFIYDLEVQGSKEKL